MLYREAGQFKSSYAADMAIFPIRQDRIALALLIAFAFIGVPLLARFHIWPLGSGAFMAIGAYSAYKFATGIHLPFDWLGTQISIQPMHLLPAILLGGLMSA